jgi:hypothetical protein
MTFTNATVVFGKSIEIEPRSPRISVHIDNSLPLCG